MQRFRESRESQEVSQLGSPVFCVLLASARVRGFVSFRLVGPGPSFRAFGAAHSGEPLAHRVLALRTKATPAPGSTASTEKKEA